MAILLFLVPSEAFAQKLTVSGLVKDAVTNEPIPGVAIMVKGTSVGTSADANGSFTIKADANAVLVCQLFGYKTVEVNVDKRTSLDIIMQEDTQTLDATVVVGYGTLKKTQLVGAVENLSGEELEGRTNSNVTRSLQGQIPGLNIIQSDGKPMHQQTPYDNVLHVFFGNVKEIVSRLIRVLLPSVEVLHLTSQDLKSVEMLKVPNIL